jgi:hypothetical protein
MDVAEFLILLLFETYILRRWVALLENDQDFAILLKWCQNWVPLLFVSRYKFWEQTEKKLTENKIYVWHP